jgi:hypothetical protein
MIYRHRSSRVRKINARDWGWQELAIDALSFVLGAAALALIVDTLI